MKRLLIGLLICALLAVCGCAESIPTPEPIPEELNAEIVTLLRSGGTANELLTEVTKRDYVVANNNSIVQNKSLWDEFMSLKDGDEPMSIIFVSYTTSPSKGFITFFEVKFDGNKFYLDEYVNSNKINCFGPYSNTVLLEDDTAPYGIWCLTDRDDLTVIYVSLDSNHDGYIPITYLNE